MKSFENSFHHAWKQKEHASYFDSNSVLSKSMLYKIYETKNEVLLLNKYKGNSGPKSIVEIGCATGEFYRYLRSKHPQFEYRGFDISPPALARARQKYPEASFNQCTEDVNSVKSAGPQPDIVFCKDVVLHQNLPFDFLGKILQIPKEAIFLRIRTRDVGATVTDPELSCQRHYDTWVPYMILNADEVIRFIQSSRTCKKIVVQKHYEILGGNIGRYLPKDCYVPETGTAETSIYVEFSDEPGITPEVTVESVHDSRPQFSLFEKVLFRVRRKLLTT